MNPEKFRIITVTAKDVDANKGSARPTRPPMQSVEWAGPTFPDLDTWQLVDDRIRAGYESPTDDTGQEPEVHTVVEKRKPFKLGWTRLMGSRVDRVDESDQETS